LNAISYTGKLEALAEFNVENIVHKTLRNDMAKTLDSAAAAQFAAAEYKAVCTATNSTVFTTDGTATATAATNASDKNHRDIIDYMKKNNIPKINGYYICIGSTNHIRGLYDAFESLIQYTKPELAFNGEVGRYYGCRIIEETNYLSNTLGSGSQYGEAVYFGDDAVREGVAVPEEVRADVPDDFGRDKAIAWYYLGGFQRIWSLATDSEEHIVHVTSA